jgi:hypothetical protein
MQLDLADPLLVWLGNADLSVGERPPDAARNDRDRFLFVSGRVKEVLVLAGLRR